MASSTDNKKSETERSLEEIRREVIESRNLVIKTDNLLKGLHAELKAVSKRQEDFEKKSWFSSGVVYFLFVFLAVTGSWLLIKAKQAATDSQQVELSKQVRQLQDELADLKQKETGRNSLTRQVSDVYRLLGQSKGEQRTKALDSYRLIDKNKLSEFEREALKERVNLVTAEIANASFERGKAAFRRAEYSNVVQELERYLDLSPSSVDGLDAQFFLGAAYFQLKKFADASSHLSQFVNGDRKSKSRDYAMLLLSQSYEQLGESEKAVEVAREALATYPGSEFVGGLKARLSASKRAGDSQMTGAVGPSNAQPAVTTDGGIGAGSGKQKTAPAESPPTGSEPKGDAGGQ